MEIASIQARGVASAFPGHFQLFWWLTLFTGFLIIWFTLLQALDHTTRRWTDILWTSSAKARDACGDSGVKRIYYSIAFTYALINVGFLLINMLWLKHTPLFIVLLTSVTPGFATGVTAVHTLYVNRRFLAKPLRAPLWREAGLVLCAVFYFSMTSLAAYGTFRNATKPKTAQAPAAATRTAAIR
jgi:hypothetical protein